MGNQGKLLSITASNLAYVSLDPLEMLNHRSTPRRGALHPLPLVSTMILRKASTAKKSKASCQCLRIAQAKTLYAPKKHLQRRQGTIDHSCISSQISPFRLHSISSSKRRRGVNHSTSSQDLLSSKQEAPTRKKSHSRTHSSPTSSHEIRSSSAHDQLASSTPANVFPQSSTLFGSTSHEFR